SNPKKDFKFITQLNDTLKKKSLDIIKIDAARKKDFHMLDSTLKIIPPILVKYSDSLRELDTKIMALKDTAQIMNYVGVLLHSSTEIGLSYWRNFQKLILGLETWSSFQNPDFKNAFGVRIAGGYLFKNKLMPNIGLDYFSKSVINMNVKPPVKEKENKFGVSFGVSVNTKKLTIGVFYSTVSHAGMRFLYAW
ncbi:MAG TPA: hypothetical protein VGE24_16530, partial [Emticicia sp.]